MERLDTNLRPFFEKSDRWVATISIPNESEVLRLTFVLSFERVHLTRSESSISRQTGIRFQVSESQGRLLGIEAFSLFAHELGQRESKEYFIESQRISQSTRGAILALAIEVPTLGVINEIRVLKKENGPWKNYAIEWKPAPLDFVFPDFR